MQIIWGLAPAQRSRGSHTTGWTGLPCGPGAARQCPPAAPSFGFLADPCLGFLPSGTEGSLRRPPSAPQRHPKRTEGHRRRACGLTQQEQARGLTPQARFKGNQESVPAAWALRAWARPPRPCPWKGAAFVPAVWPAAYQGDQSPACWRYGTREAIEMLAVCVVLNLQFVLTVVKEIRAR